MIDDDCQSAKRLLSGFEVQFKQQSLSLIYQLNSTPIHFCRTYVTLRLLPLEFSSLNLGRVYSELQAKEFLCESQLRNPQLASLKSSGLDGTAENEVNQIQSEYLQSYACMYSCRQIDRQRRKQPVGGPGNMFLDKGYRGLAVVTIDLNLISVLEPFHDYSFK